MSKHWRKIGSKNQASIPSSPQYHTTTLTTTAVAYIKQHTHTKYTQINVNKSECNIQDTNAVHVEGQNYGVGGMYSYATRRE